MLVIMWIVFSEDEYLSGMLRVRIMSATDISIRTKAGIVLHMCIYTCTCTYTTPISFYMTYSVLINVHVHVHVYIYVQYNCDDVYFNTNT